MAVSKRETNVLIFLMASVFKLADSKLMCRIDIDSANGLWRDVTPMATDGATQCDGYSYRETNPANGPQKPRAGSGHGDCVLYRNADTHAPCLATCEESCLHGYQCTARGICPCQETTARYNATRMCVPLESLRACAVGETWQHGACRATSCNDACPNGRCDARGVCSCVLGFARHPKSGACVPSECLHTCVTGTCHAYGECTCTEGVAGTEGGRYECGRGEAANVGTGKREKRAYTRCSWTNWCKNGRCDRDSGNCKCNKGYKANKKENTCEIIVCPDWEREDYCRKKCPLCAIANGWCEKGVCICKEGFKKDSTDKKKCVRIVCPERDPTNYCQRECKRSRCSLNNGECVQGICICNNGFKRDANDIHKCVEIYCPDLDHTNYCRHRTCQNSSCTQTNGQCDAVGVCQCVVGFKPDPNDEYKCDKIDCPDSEHAAYCQGECQRSGCARANGRCDEQGECICDESFKRELDFKYKCVSIVCPERDPTSYCQRQCDSTVCAQSNGRCDTQGECQCLVGFKPDPNDKAKCQRIDCPSSASEDDAFCLTQCNATCSNGECSQAGVCRCREGFVSSNSTAMGCHEYHYHWAVWMGGVVGSLILIVAVVVVAVLVAKARIRKTGTIDVQEGVQDFPMAPPDTEPEYANYEQEEETVENTLYHTFDCQSESRGVR